MKEMSWGYFAKVVQTLNIYDVVSPIVYNSATNSCTFLILIGQREREG